MGTHTQERAINLVLYKNCTSEPKWFGIYQREKGAGLLFQTINYEKPRGLGPLWCKPYLSRVQTPDIPKRLALTQQKMAQANELDI